MKFSVLMAVYSKEKPAYFDAAIKSIVDQTLKPNEIVIVKDGPLTPELENVLEKYTKKYNTFKIISLEKNSGLGIALNVGIQNCSYDVIARADSDDVSVLSRFKKQIDFLESHPEVSILSANIIEYDEDLKTKQSQRNVPETDGQIKQYIKKRSPFNHMAVVYRKSEIEKAGSYEDCPYFEDYYLWCKVYVGGGNFYNIQEPLIHARGGVSLISRRGGFSYAHNTYNFLKKAYKIGAFSKIDFIRNLILRVSISLTPISIRSKIYKKALRSK